MRRWGAMGIAVICAMLATSGCQTGAATRGAPVSANDDALTRLSAALAGEYDNDEQVRQSRAAVHAGTALAVPHLRETWRLLDQSRERSFWLWRLQSLDRSDAATALWLY